MVLKNVNNIADYDFLKKLSSNGPVFLLKHSSTCPVSGTAYNEFVKFCEQNSGIPCFVLVIQSARNISNFVEEDTGIKHESPQVIVFNKGKSVWKDSHYLITCKKLVSVLDEISN